MGIVEVVEIIGLGLVVAANPLPVIGQLALVTRDDGRAPAVGFAAGWAGILVLIASLLTAGAAALLGAVLDLPADAGLRSGDDPAAIVNGTSWGAWVPVAIGAALVVLGVFSWAKKPRTTPSRMNRAFDSLTPGKAVALGAGLAVVKPKTIAALLAVSAIIGAEGRIVLSSMLLVAIFTAVGSIGVGAPLLLAAFNSRRINAALTSVQRALVRNSSRITGGLLVAIGAIILAFGLSQLLR